MDAYKFAKIYNFNNYYTTELNTILSPAINIGFDIFFYSKIYHKPQRIFSLCNNMPWCRYFWDHNIMHSLHFKKAITNAFHKKQYISFPDVNCSHFNIYNMISNFELISPDYIENWGFATSNPQNNVKEFYINNQTTFRLLLYQFKEKANYFIKKGEENKLFYPGVNIDNRKVLIKNKDPLIEDIKPQKWHIDYLGNNLSFTTKQIECLMHVSKGLSIKEIARIYSISTKTVEFHLKSIKEKTGCNFKSDLIKFAQINHIDKLL